MDGSVAHPEAVRGPALWTSDPLVAPNRYGSQPTPPPPRPNLQVTALLNQRLTRLECGLPQPWQPRYQKLRLTLVILCSKLEALLHGNGLYRYLIRRARIPPLLLFLLTLMVALALTRRLYMYTAHTLFQTVGFLYPALQTIQTLLSLDGETLTLTDTTESPTSLGEQHPTTYHPGGAPLPPSAPAGLSPTSALHAHSRTSTSGDGWPGDASSQASSAPFRSSFTSASHMSARPSAWDYYHATTTASLAGSSRSASHHASGGPTAAGAGSNLDNWLHNSLASRRWLLYWLLYGSLQFADHTLGWCLRFVPYYSLLRIVALAWAQHPWSPLGHSFYRRIGLPLYARWATRRAASAAASWAAATAAAVAAGTVTSGDIYPDSAVASDAGTTISSGVPAIRTDNLSINTTPFFGDDISALHSPPPPPAWSSAAAWAEAGARHHHHHPRSARPSLSDGILSPTSNTLQWPDPLTQPYYCMDSSSNDLTSAQFFQSPDPSASMQHLHPHYPPSLYSENGQNSTPTTVRRRTQRSSLTPRPSLAATTTTTHAVTAYPASLSAGASRDSIGTTTAIRSRANSAATDISSTTHTTPMIRLSSRPMVTVDMAMDVSVSPLSPHEPSSPLLRTASTSERGSACGDDHSDDNNDGDGATPATTATTTEAIGERTHPTVRRASGGPTSLDDTKESGLSYPGHLTHMDPTFHPFADIASPARG
ncbi:hypothetical protein IWQ60_012016 [Tieghemiomyces parasiticus]|uniref:Uncharacterized protein n=1 Tax=Tieghemiomyces parasiticus TaxID=78921 RepID=A0A9W8DL49_9FUNG|nr:hypothetical protein IWQ60_012016 [Tieghemiomyces parasiticus]